MGNSVMLNGVEYAGEQIAYKDSTYELVSKVAYLIGVPLRIFQNEHEPPKIEIYDRLEQDKNARIIRNLCIIRTAIERNYRKINDIMRIILCNEMLDGWHLGKVRRKSPAGQVKVFQVLPDFPWPMVMKAQQVTVLLISFHGNGQSK